MPAIPEMTIQCENLDIIEGLRQTGSGIPKLQLAHTRGIDQHSTLRKNKQPPRRRCVAAPRIIFANLANDLSVCAKKPVDQSRLPHSGRAQEGGGLSGFQVRIDVVEA